MSDDVKSCVKLADIALLATEARDLLPVRWRGWEEIYLRLALPETVVPWSSNYAEEMFLKSFQSLFTSSE